MRRYGGGGGGRGGGGGGAAERDRAGVLAVESVLRPLDLGCRRRSRCRRRRKRELLRRRAADVSLALQPVDDDGRDEPRAEHGDDGKDNKKAPHDGGSGYPGDVKIPPLFVVVRPAEFAARSVTCHVPAGSPTTTL